MLGVPPPKYNVRGDSVVVASRDSASAASASIKVPIGVEPGVCLKNEQYGQTRWQKGMWR
jgi:hypothetical protein